MSGEHEQRQTAPEYDALVFSGGGVHGFSMLGATCHLQNQVLDMRRVSTLVGTSAGSLVAATVALGRAPRDMLALAARNPLLSYLSVNFDGLMSGYGLDSGRGLQRLIDDALGRTVTFEQLSRETGKNLVVVATCVDSKRAKYFSAQDTPECAVNLAIRMSCSVPLMFDCVWYQGHSYVDGGLTDHLAVGCDQLRGLRVLGVSILHEDRPVQSFAAYLGALAGLATASKTTATTRPATEVYDRLRIPVGDSSAMGLGVGHFGLARLFRMGEQAAREFAHERWPEKCGDTA